MPIVLQLPSGGAVTFEIDPASEDAANSPLTISGAPYRLREVDLTQPDIDPRYASSVDTEGDLPVSIRHRNRHIVLTLMLTDLASHSAFEAAMGDLVKKLMKLHREGGTLKMTTPAGTTAVADVLTVTTKPTLDQLWPARKIGTIQIDFEARPYLRGAPVQLADHVETTSPVLVFTEDGAGLAGDVPALGRLMLDNDQTSQDQGWLTWGLQSRYYDSAASAALFYEAEGRTVQGGASAVAGPSGASGAGSNVVRLTSMPASPISMLSTQATGAGAHLSHVGTFRVWARVQTPTANGFETNIALEWGTGDLLRSQRNATTTIPTTWGGGWRLIDLGLVSIPKIVSGTQRWEGRVVVWGAAAGGSIDIDYVFLVPADEGSGAVTSIQSVNSPTSFTARDEFDQTAGNLTGKVAPTGGTWVVLTGSDTDDLTVNATDHMAERTAVSDTGAFSTLSGRAVGLDLNIGPTVAQMDWKTSVDETATRGLLVRTVDASNFLVASIHTGTDVGLTTIRVRKAIGGVLTLLAVEAFWPISAFTDWQTLRVVVIGGQFYMYMGRQGERLTLALSGYDSTLAGGGTLATGDVYIWDNQTAATASTRNYDNFWVTVPPVDAAAYALQSVEVRENQVLREDSTGSFWNTPSSYEGDYLKPPPGGKEARPARFIAKMSRNPPGIGEDSGIDDLSGRLTVVPRYLLLPS